MAPHNQFAEALRAQDPVRLRQAFEDCAKEAERAPHRTTLNKWLDGTVPQRGVFVRRLAAELGDDSIYDAWKATRGGRAASTAEAVVSQYESLEPDDKQTAFYAIRSDFVSQYPSTRERLAYRVEINDPSQRGDDHLQVKVSISWEGAIPANANVQFVTEQTTLGSAYDEGDCIFREVLGFETERLDELLEATTTPVLNINPLGTEVPHGTHYIGERSEPGLYRFDNGAAELAQVRVNVSYPYPRGCPVFFIRFGRYQVPNTATVTLVLNSSTASEPRAFPYLPPGVQREWASSFVPPDEMFVSLGTGTTALSEGDGVVLYWKESHPDG